jgi:UDP-N-acetylmuramate--alanine ligase
VELVDQAELLIQKGGWVHLMGIGGIGMAGLAILLKQRGFSVSGCDLQENRQTAHLRRCGIDIFFGHSEEHIEQQTCWLIRSTAVPDHHPEVRRARELGIEVSRRGEVLPALMRDRISIAVAGTHGKTTTTAMLAQVLNCGFCVGGEMVGIEGVARDGELMVVEADESDGTVAGYTPDYAVITNIEYDHMEHHASEAAFVGCFEQLVKQTKKTVFYCSDNPIASQVCSGNPKCEPFHFPSSPIALPLPGNHNQWNAAATLAVSKLWKPESEIFQALGKITPIRRRFERVFEKDGICIISDYAHHPTEVAALVQTAQELKPSRLLAIFQPHRYTRTRALADDFPASFDGVDELWVVPVYAASEPPLEGGATLDLMNHFPNVWNKRLHYFQTLEAAWANIQPILRTGDMLLIVGAGDIEKMAEWAARLS